MEQYFILDGILKRVVSNPEGKEMILRFADENDMETSYAALRLGTPTPYGIVCVTKARVASLPLEGMDRLSEPACRRPRNCSSSLVMRGMSEIMAHTITLHLLDAAGARASVPAQASGAGGPHSASKELASYLNLSAETLSRLRKRGKIGSFQISSAFPRRWQYV